MNKVSHKVKQPSPTQPSPRRCKVRQEIPSRTLPSWRSIVGSLATLKTIPTGYIKILPSEITGDSYAGNRSHQRAVLERLIGLEDDIESEASKVRGRNPNTRALQKVRRELEWYLYP